MGDSNRFPNGQQLPHQNFRRRMPDGTLGRGFQQGFDFTNRDNNFHPGRGPPHLGGRGVGPPPPPHRGRGHRFGPPPGRGFNSGRERFMDHGLPMGRGPPPMSRGFVSGTLPPPPPPPPPPMQGPIGRNVPPPPPPRHHPGQWSNPRSITPMLYSHQPPNTHYGQAQMNRFPGQNHLSPMIPNTSQQQPGLQPMFPISSAAASRNQLYTALGQGNMAASNSVPQSAAPSQIDEAWTEHTAPNSMKYFYNGITKESTFTKPEALMRSTGTNTSGGHPWVEYKDAATGKEYYSNGVMTTWEKPDGFEVSTKVQPEVNDEERPKKKKKTSPPESVAEFRSKSEATAGFKGLLLAKDIQPTMKWNDVVKTCSSDPSWEACEILTQGERKQALAEYQTKRANELRDLEREERMRAKDAFTKLLADVLSTVDTFNPVTSRFIEIRDFLSKDERFYAVEDEPAREALFLEFCEEMRKREERNKRNKKREAKLTLFSFLRECEESGELTFASKWSSFAFSLDEKSRSDPRFQVSAVMSESDRELYFSDFVIELQAAEDEKRRRIREARHRAEKAQREEYMELLCKLAKEGTIVPSTKWRNVEDLLSPEAPFGQVKVQDREAPRELFQDFIDEWNDAYRRDRIFLVRLTQPLSGKGVNVSNETTYDKFSKALLDAAAHSPEQYADIRRILKSENPVSSVQLYFNELKLRTKEAAHTVTKRNTRRGSVRDESSEDEGEIVEDGEIIDDGGITD